MTNDKSKQYENFIQNVDQMSDIDEDEIQTKHSFNDLHFVRCLLSSDSSFKLSIIHLYYPIFI